MIKNKRVVFVSLFMVLVLVIAGCTGADNPDEGNMDSMDHENMDMNEKDENMGGMNNKGETNGAAQDGRTTAATKNVTRIAQDDPVKAAIETAQIVWPATSEANRPGTVLLGVTDNWATNLAAVTLIHHPNNGPLLYAGEDQIPEATMDEIERLNPIGSDTNNGVQVITVGDFADNVQQQLEDAGWKVDTITGSDPVELAAQLDAYYAKVADQLPTSVIVGAVESPDYTLPAANWIAHMPEPLLYVNRDGIPDATKEALAKRDGKANIYLLGPKEAVLANVEEQLGEYGKVTRISGPTPEENAIAFAKYKDKSSKFGWGITEPGHGLTFNLLSNPEAAIASAPFAHLGKHAPMLIMEQPNLSDTMMDYIASLQPSFKDDPTVGPYNHAFLIGSGDAIPFSTQGMIDQMLEIISEGGGGHGGH